MDLDLIKINVQADTSTDVINLLGKEMLQKGYVKDTYVDAVLKREETLPTGLDLNGFGVAIPHTDSQHVNKATIGVAVLSNPVKFHSMVNPKDELYVKLVFLLAIEDPNGQVELLQKLMGVFQNVELLKSIESSQSKADIEKKLEHIFY